MVFPSSFLTFNPLLFPLIWNHSKWRLMLMTPPPRTLPLFLMKANSPDFPGPFCIFPPELDSSPQVETPNFFFQHITPFLWFSPFFRAVSVFFPPRLLFLSLPGHLPNSFVPLPPSSPSPPGFFLPFFSFGTFFPS